ncbi:hypothetical protein DOY81_005081 [Sarcophaga bullata]|nr:hypothetical protein DOY81_005081 [Sarcophaga bullata]
MITDRNKLNFVTIQWLWFLCLILFTFSGSTNIWIQNVEATQQQQHQTQTQTQPQQQQQQQEHDKLQQQLKSALQLQQDIQSNGPIQQTQKQQQQQQHQDVTVRNFSPRMDYNNNEWRPVGRGDPLKNDPTFDYSPPTLDRVRYWADPDKDKEKVEEVSAALVDAKLKKANPGKNEILLLGVTGDRLRGSGATLHKHQAPNMLKNAKGETPLLQPKYTSIRRSYYAHQLPTHLMPPPMQPMVPATQQNQLQQPQMQQQHQMQSMHMMKPVHTEYRHNMPTSGHTYMNSSPISSMSGHSKQHYMTSATQPWMHTSSSTTSSPSGHSVIMISGNSHRYPHPNSHDSHYHAPDSHHQESVNYVTYHSRPSVSSTPSLTMPMSGGSVVHHDIYSPNSIRGPSSVHKSSTSSRKPWIHDLLQKEFIKPIKPTQNPNSYHVETVKSQPHMDSHFEPIFKPKGISTTYAPVTFVTPTTTMPSTTTTQTIYITSTSQQQTTSTSPSPRYTTTPMPTTQHTTPHTTTTLSSTRLLIPNTSNLAYRPTVAPIKMTTDSLFKHYHQPEKPLRGPMYLIIEGHSKVKTYGKDELDPHKPKIVPIIPNREPVVRIADPNEKRGTPETFQVKHLHTKTTQPMATTTTTTATTKPTTTTTITTTTTTKKPQAKTTAKTTAKPITTAKPKTTNKPTTTTVKPTTKKPIMPTTTTTVKPLTAKPAPKLSVSTTTVKPKNEKTQSKDDIATAKFVPKMTNPNALETPKKPSQTLIKEPPTSMQALITEPPTGMQGLLSFLDSSLDSLLKEEPLANAPETKEATTKLKPLPMKNNNAQQIPPAQIEARVSTKLEPIKAEDYEDYVNDNYFQFTTEYLPRETRKIYDREQLPESRINLEEDAKFEDFLGEIDDDDNMSAFSLDDVYEDDEEEEGAGNIDNTHNIIKRIDTLVSDSIEDDFDDLSSTLDDDEEEDGARKNTESLQSQQQTIRKA